MEIVFSLLFDLILYVFKDEFIFYYVIVRYST